MRFMRSILWDIHDRAIYSKRDRRDRRRARYQAESNAVWNARLPPFSLNGKPLALMSSQQQSLFFKKLPLELRRLIYTYALSEEKLQVDIVDEDERAPFRLRCLAAQRLLAFPKSCKMAYLEAAHLIYASNTFQIPSITALLCFQRLVATNLFQSIQDMHLRWADPEVHDVRAFLDDIPPHNISSWRQTCQAISEIKGLKRLRIDMALYSTDTNSRWVDSDWEFVLFSSLEIVQGVEEFVVCTRWGGEDQPIRLNETKVWPFTVRRGIIDIA